MDNSIEITRYSCELLHEWNQFVDHSKNATFLLNRSYMDYHADRFSDCSLVIRSKGRIVALFPANISGSIVFSHGGLTYGGLITDHRMTANLMIDIVRSINDFIKVHIGATAVVYKPSPWIYHSMPSEEDLYALSSVCHASLSAREISSTICLDNRPNFSELRRRCVKKAEKAGIDVRECDDFSAFWQILSTNLKCKYGVSPVHSLEEILLLKHRFPKQIRLFLAFLDDVPLAGTVIFDTPQVLHSQYIAASPQGKDIGALDAIFAHIIGNCHGSHRFFDFGKSTEQHGKYLNSSLIFQKEGFGGRAVCYDTYTWYL